MMQLPYLGSFPLPFFTHFSLKRLNTHMLESNYITHTTVREIVWALPLP